MKAKIFVAYHTPAQLLKDDVFVPIHVGRALNTTTKDGTIDDNSTQWMYRHCVGDNNGDDNISILNRQYCELTAFYWVWKNLDSFKGVDYIGFMHYRRHLRFNENLAKEDEYGLIHYKTINDQYIIENSLDKLSIEKLIKDYDVVVGKKWDVRNAGSKTVFDHYKFSSPFLHIKDYISIIDILKKKHPQYIPTINEFNSDHSAYFTNIFIMKKELFNDYCNWLFPLLHEFDKITNISLYNIQEYRVNGYLSEWLFSIWLKHNKPKLKELQRTIIDNPKINLDFMLKKQFDSDSVTICMATDVNYIKYITVALQSIKENISPNRNYEINILIPSDTIENIHHIKALACNNFKIRLINIEKFIDNHFNKIKMTGSGHISRSTYYRLFIPKLFDNYAKVLYLDSDLVVNTDIANLYDVEIQNNLIAGVLDFELIRWYSSDSYIKNYIDNKLEHKDVMKYINAGVCLMNINELKKCNFTDVAVDYLSDNSPLFHDQDILNKLCFNRIHYLEPEWNVEYHIPIWNKNWKQQIPLSLLDLYSESRKHPKITHFSGGLKPWQKPSIELADHFWKYARKSSVYEMLLTDILKIEKETETESQIKNNKNDLICAKYKYKFYSFFNKITMDKIHKLHNGYVKYSNLHKNK